MTETPKEPPEGFKLEPFDFGFSGLAMPFYLRRDDDGVTLGFYVRENHINPGQIAHGGLLMTLVDMAFGISVGSQVEDAGFLPTTSLSYDFIQPARLGEWIESRIDFLHVSRKRAVVSGSLIGDNGVVVRANGTFKIMRKDDTRIAMPEELKARFDKENRAHD